MNIDFSLGTLVKTYGKLIIYDKIIYGIKEKLKIIKIKIYCRSIKWLALEMNGMRF
jgi:alpha-acetolactate decarboxylase